MKNSFNENLRFYNTVYLRQTKAEYDNSNTNQTGYEGDNKMGSLQFGLENQIDTQKANYIFTIMFMTENTMKEELLINMKVKF